MNSEFDGLSVCCSSINQHAYLNPSYAELNQILADLKVSFATATPVSIIYVTRYVVHTNMDSGEANSIKNRIVIHRICVGVALGFERITFYLEVDG